MLLCITLHLMFVGLKCLIHIDPNLIQSVINSKKKIYTRDNQRLHHVVFISRGVVRLSVR